MIPNKTEHEGASATKPFLAAMGVKKKYRKKRKKYPHSNPEKTIGIG